MQNVQEFLFPIEPPYALIVSSTKYLRNSSAEIRLLSPVNVEMILAVLSYGLCINRFNIYFLTILILANPLSGVNRYFQSEQNQSQYSLCIEIIANDHSDSYKSDT